jgi:glycosyltransferase involved in cell wall biosynthesis
MRILHVTPAFPPSTGYGGGPSVVHQVCRRLAERGHEVIVYTTDANDERSRLVAGCRTVDGAEVHYFRNVSNWMAYRFKLFAAPQMAWVMKPLLSRIDIIHVHDLRTFQSMLVHRFSTARPPYVLQAHGVMPKAGQLGMLKSVFDALWGARILQDAAGLIALNEREAEAYTELGVAKETIHVVPNGVDLSEYRMLPRQGMFRERYGLDEAKVILYLGRIHDSKGLDLLMQSFAGLTEQLSEVKLVVAGPDDGYLASLEDLIGSSKLEQHVVFTGFLSGKEKLAAYVDADVFATPRFTGFPLTFLEAMACGLPIVTTDAGDYIEGIDGRAGYVTQWDSDKYTCALHQILANPLQRAMLSEGARKMVREYDWDLIVARVESLYREILR